MFTIQITDCSFQKTIKENIRVQVCKIASGKPIIRKFSIEAKTIMTLSSKM